MDDALCPHFGVCGGCSHQDVPYEEQLNAKQRRVQGALRDLSIGSLGQILPSATTTFYRNKMEYSFGDERDVAIIENLPRPPSVGRVHLGLHPKGRFALVTPTPQCGLESAEACVILDVVSTWATQKKVPVFVRKTAEGDLRHLVVREGKNTGERLVNLVAKSTTLHVDDLARRLKTCGVPITTFLWSRYDGLSDVARSGERKIYWGDGFIQEKLGDAVLQVNPNSFMQTNTHAAENMVKLLRRWMALSLPAGPTPLAGESNMRGVFLHRVEEAEPAWRAAPKGSTLIDLYCGSGAIGLSLANEFESVIGVELNHEAVIDANENARASGTSNIHFVEGKAEEVAGALPVQERAENTVVIVDPPRPGLHPGMVKTLLEWSVPWLFYVSCNPESLGRDLRALSERYDILDVQPMDFFPHTDHVETAVRMRRKPQLP